MTDNRMKLNLHNEKTGLTLILRHDEGLTSQDVLDAYRLVNRESHDEVAKSVKKPINIEINGVNVAKAASLTVKERPEPKSRPKAFNMVGSERSLKTPLGELTDFSNVDDRVLVAIDCPSCGYSGDVKVPEHFKFCKCPNCELKLFNSWATGAPGEKDEAGYAFYADSEMIFKNPEEV